MTSIHRLINTERLSTHDPHEPEIPQMLYPRGGITLWLQDALELTSNAGSAVDTGLTYAVPPRALPKTGDFLPRLVNS